MGDTSESRSRDGIGDKEVNLIPTGDTGEASEMTAEAQEGCPLG